MIITFNKGAKQFVYNLLRPSVKDRDCPFCGVPVRAKNFAGAIQFHDEPRFMDGGLPCLMAYAHYLKGQEDASN